jgi:hypothetical protein
MRLFIGTDRGKYGVNMESARFTARLTAYSDAIAEARKAGITWAQLAALFDVKPKTMAAAYKVAISGKYIAPEQLPLPGTGTKTEHKKAATEKTEHEPHKPRPLPGQIPVGDGDEMAKALEKKGIIFK